METFHNRIKRIDNNGIEVIETLLNSIQNHFLQVIIKAKEEKIYHLMLLGIFSVVEIINESVFLKEKKDIDFYFENFIDFQEDGFRFSNISRELKDYRNVIAHQCISKLGHRIYLNTQLNTGYIKDNQEKIVFNPDIFCNQFLSAFYDKSEDNSFYNAFFMDRDSGLCTKYKVWDYKKMFIGEHTKNVARNFVNRFNKR